MDGMTSPTKPPKPTDTLPRVSRGGGWFDTVPSMLRSAFRVGGTPAVRDFDLGFRCAQRGCCQQVLKVTP